MAMRDKVSMLPVAMRVVAANMLVDSRPFDEVREALAAAGVTTELMPSDGSFRAFQETREYRQLYDGRLRAESLAFEAVAGAAQVADVKAVVQARLLQGMLADLEGGEMRPTDRISMWKTLAAEERLTETQADRREAAEARLALQTRKVDADLAGKAETTRVSSLKQLTLTIQTLNEDSMYREELTEAVDLVRAQLLVTASADPLLCSALEEDLQEYGAEATGSVRATPGAARTAAARENGGAANESADAACDGAATPGATPETDADAEAGMGGFRAISGDFGGSGAMADAGSPTARLVAAARGRRERLRARKAARETAYVEAEIRKGSRAGAYYLMQRREEEAQARWCRETQAASAGTAAGVATGRSAWTSGASGKGDAMAADDAWDDDDDDLDDDDLDDDDLDEDDLDEDDEDRDDDDDLDEDWDENADGDEDDEDDLDDDDAVDGAEALDHARPREPGDANGDGDGATTDGAAATDAPDTAEARAKRLAMLRLVLGLDPIPDSVAIDCREFPTFQPTEADWRACWTACDRLANGLLKSDVLALPCRSLPQLMHDASPTRTLTEQATTWAAHHGPAPWTRILAHLHLAHLHHHIHTQTG